jgi:hypothetical protein
VAMPRGSRRRGTRHRARTVSRAPPRPPPSHRRGA